MSKISTRTITGLFLCTALLFPAQAVWCAEASGLEDEIAARERARYELHQKILQYNETADKKSQQARGLQARLAGLEKNAELARQQIKVLELQSEKLQNSMSALDVEIAEISRQIDILMDELRMRVVNIHKYGSREELNLLLSAESAHDAVASAYLLGRLARHDRLAIDGLVNKIAGLERGKRGIESNKAQIAARTDELSLQREKYDQVIKQTSATLSGVQSERRRAEASAQKTEQARLEIDRAIAELMRRKREGRQDAPAVGPAVPRTYPVLGQGARLDWPVRGAVVGRFGTREHPVFKTKSFNSGIDISAAPGAPVQAAGPGEVLYEGWLKGFGQVVIIDHGRNISTVYAHLASTKVKERDAVMPGTLIGTVGKENSGATEGCSLHFEVRVGDAAKNPLDYLSGA